MRSNANHPLIKLALFILLICFVVTFISLQLKLNSLKSEYSVLESEIEAAEDRIAELRSKLDTPFDEEYVISVARDRLNLRLPDETVFFSDLLK